MASVIGVLIRAVLLFVRRCIAICPVNGFAHVQFLLLSFTLDSSPPQSALATLEASVAFAAVFTPLFPSSHCIKQHILAAANRRSFALVE
ncbi:hypothetical protein SNOG_04878 [Parastagonospora nodorum SN15]|uniref:Secreted protein n=1 Tax=Phaeosphaeria nodorum (strain SN15 / ATCC MYA-4574 / FGSC 10173) TaxID=321614 RepID=Q0UTN6_PHANO|nr:hypothetical protein SNOG_04878 [Parastagonospora nodorum SN15]EAT87269.1 hypothetical protein SNOG_04878 [Parastagonospora nodorum SN15]